MQDKVPVVTARSFAGAFYAKLLEHGRVDLACNQARAHVKTDKLPGSSIPVLFMRLHNGRLLEVPLQGRTGLPGGHRPPKPGLRREVHTHAGRCGTGKAADKDVSSRVPSSLVPPEFVLLRKRGAGPQAEIERIEVPDLRKAIEENRRLVVLGEPGSGKTTTLWDLAYHHAREAQEDAQAPLPIFVPLGGYTGPEPALEYAKAQVGDLDRNWRRS